MSNEYVLLVHADDPKLLPTDPNKLSRLLGKGTTEEVVLEPNTILDMSDRERNLLHIGDKDIPNLEDRLEDNNIIAMHVFDSYDVMVREASIMIASGYPTITVFIHGLSYLRGYLKLPRTQRGQHHSAPSLVRHNLTNNSHFRTQVTGVEYAAAASVVEAAQELIVELESAC